MTLCCLLFVIVSAPAGGMVSGVGWPVPLAAHAPAGWSHQPAEAVLPVIDEGAFSSEQLAAWRDVRARFLATARHVARTQWLVDELSFRLHVRGFFLRDADVARAARMHGFLDESIAFIAALDFDRASQALARADHEHARLREVVGQ